MWGMFTIIYQACLFVGIIFQENFSTSLYTPSLDEEKSGLAFFLSFFHAIVFQFFGNLILKNQSWFQAILWG
jgi:hypothetical protein